LTLSRCLIGPLQAQPLDTVLQQELPEAHFFTYQNFSETLEAVKPEGLLLLEPLQRALPPEVWTHPLWRVGLSSWPAHLQPAVAQPVLAALDGVIALEAEILKHLPEGLPVSPEPVWELAQSHFEDSRHLPLLVSALYILQQSWSEQLARYQELPLTYFVNVHPARLRPYLGRAGLIVLDSPRLTSLHFQILAAGGALWVPESQPDSQQALAAYLTAGRDYRVYAPEQLAAELELHQPRAVGLYCPPERLQPLRLRNSLPQALAALLPQLSAPHPVNTPELTVRQLSLSAENLAWPTRQQQLQTLPETPEKRLQEAWFYLQIVQTPFLRTPPEQVWQVLERLLSDLPESLDRQLFQLSLALKREQYAQALAILEAQLLPQTNPGPLLCQGTWAQDPVFQDLAELWGATQALPLYWRYLQAWCLAHLHQAPAALAVLADLLREAYFFRGLLLWLRLAEPQLEPGQEPVSAEMLACMQTLLARHPQALELAEPYVRQLAHHDRSQAQQICEDYLALSQCLPSHFGAVERWLQLRRDLHGLDQPQENSLPLIYWEGPGYAYSSLAGINRRWLTALAQDPELELAWLPFEPPEQPPDEALQALQTLPWLAPEIFVAHRWPPRSTAPQAGRWVNIFPWEFGVIPQRWAQDMNQGLDAIWVPSRFVAHSFAISGVDPARLVVIPNGVDTELYRPEGEVLALPTQRRLRFLFVGGLVFRKGVDILLKAYRQAFSTDDDVVLVLKSFGAQSHYALQGLHRQLAELQADPQAPEIVLLDQDLTPAEMAALYRSCQVYVHPYRGEGFGMPILEAMACGLPVVIPNAGPAPEFCPPEAGWQLPTRIRFEPGLDVQDQGSALGNPYYCEVDMPALVSRLQALAAEPDSIQAAAQAARTAALAYDWEALYPSLKQAIQALLQRPWAHREQALWLQRQLAQIQQDPTHLALALTQQPAALELLERFLAQTDRRRCAPVWQRALQAGLPLQQAQALAQHHPHLKLWPPLPLRLYQADLPLPLPRLQSKPHLTLLTEPVAAHFSLGCQPVQTPVSDARLRYLTSSRLPETWPTDLGAAHQLWYSHPDHLPALQALGLPDIALHFQPLAVDFGHFSPQAEPLPQPESEGRFVFLSIFDWQQDTGWQDLLRAYCLSFSEADPVSLLLKPFGAEFDEMAEELMDWLVAAGLDPETIPSLSFVQADLELASLPGLYRGANCFVTAQAQGEGIWHLAAQACGLPVIACGHYPFLQRPFAEVFAAGDIQHLSWLLQQHLVDLPPHQGQIVRDYLIQSYDAPAWRQRAEAQLLRTALWHQVTRWI